MREFKPLPSRYQMTATSNWAMLAAANMSRSNDSPAHLNKFQIISTISEYTQKIYLKEIFIILVESCAIKFVQELDNT